MTAKIFSAMDDLSYSPVYQSSSGSPRLAMQPRLKGLKHECDLLAAEIARHEAGELREYDTAPDGTRIDITDLWVAHLRSLLAEKRALLARLIERYAVRGFDRAGCG
jgi:hypothetical protein